MSSKLVFELNREGVAELMKSEEMQNILNGYAEGIASRAGEGYGTSSHVGKTRANANVFPETFEANRDNLENNTLLKAMGG